MSDPARAQRIADYFDALHRTRAKLPPVPADLRPADLDEAYGVQEILQARWAPKRGPIAGYKIAITTKVMQELMGLDQPCAGAIFTRTVHQSPAMIRMADHVNVAVECEIAMRLSADLPGEGGAYDRDSVAAAVASCHAAIELIEDHHADYKTVDALGLAANNAWNAGCVLGPAVSDWRRLDLAALGGTMSIEGVEQGRGKGADVLGHPLNALAWLANKLVERDRPLVSGMVVLTGSIVSTKWPARNQTVTVRIDKLGEASARFV
jgi:2-keto-4-pentenoate hydratase